MMIESSVGMTYELRSLSTELCSDDDRFNTCIAVQAGEVVMLESWVSAEWMTGTTGNGRGMFPVNFVEVVEALPSQPAVSASRLAVMSDGFLFRVPKRWEFIRYRPPFNGVYQVNLG